MSTNPTNKTQYFYSSRGELLTVILPDGKRIDYFCDPLGRRIAKKVNGVVVEKYLWQGLTRLLAVYNGNNSLMMRFEYADERMPVAMKMGSATYYLNYDQVGSLRLVADGSGNVVKRISCDSFGNILEDTNPSFTIPFGFAGGLHDRDTGLVRFGYRDYDPEVGRWTAKDPIGFAGGDTDLYGYVLSNPIYWIDPTGLDVNIAVNRIAFMQNSIVGTISVTSTVANSTFSGYTLERRNPPNTNLPVPPGIYSGLVRPDRTPNRVELSDVLRASNIQIHVGNTIKDVTGCFAVGISMSTDSVIGSTDAMNSILNIISADGSGSITITVGAYPMGR